jgi:hypothetical protein
MQTSKIEEQLQAISTLLRDSSFALEMAQHQEAAYYASLGQAIPPFSEVGDDKRYMEYPVKEEKIATSIAAFYALESATAQLIKTKGGTPYEWLNKITGQKLDTADILLLNRFANAAWKAGQPFRSLDRITRDNFIAAYFLSEEEIQKDFDQVYAAAVMLKKQMQDVGDSSLNVQLQKISALLHSGSFALEMAQHLEAAYYKGIHEPAPAFLKPGEDTAVVRRSIKAEKIAVNIAGFYALECGLSYLASSRNVLPSDVLRSVIADSISEKDKELLERFANLTWKAGQPFRGLSRIARPGFTVFDLLPQHEKDKDWVQINAAAKKLREKLDWH